MKEVALKNGKVVRTPWLRIEEAAAYCGLSRSAFVAHARALPHAGNERTRLYNVKTLDAWLAGNLDIPFDPEGEVRAPWRQSHRQPAKGLVDNVTGKVYTTSDVLCFS